jgi:hypothetical protein
MRAFLSLPTGFLAVAFAAQLATAQSPDDGHVIDWLIVVQGEVTNVADGAMSLAVPPSAVAFSDRPDRLVGLVDLGRFLALAWADDGDLGENPPNASLVDETDGEIAVIEISGMALAEGTLEIAYSLLDGNAPSAGDRIAVTIDAFPTTVNGQITDIVSPN